MQTITRYRTIAILLAILLLLAACGGDDPTPEPAAAPTTAPTVAPTVAPTDPPAPTNTPEPTVAPTESPLPTPGDRGIGESPLATPVAESPLATPDSQGINMGDDPLLPQQIERARARLLEEIDGISADDITVVSAEAVDWPDGSLGCPEPGMMYGQVVTRGYKVVLEANGEEYPFHTDANPDGQLILCTEG